MGRWDKDLRSKIAPVAAQTLGERRDLPQKQSTALLPLKGSRSPRKGQRSSCSHLSPTLPPLPGVLPESRAHRSPWEKVGICPTDQMGSDVTSDPNSSCFPGPRVARGMGTNHKKNSIQQKIGLHLLEECCEEGGVFCSREERELSQDLLPWDSECLGNLH